LYIGYASANLLISGLLLELDVLFDALINQSFNIEAVVVEVELIMSLKCESERFIELLEVVVDL